MSCTAAAAALSALFGLSNCAEPPRSSGAPSSLQADLGNADARLDTAQARAVISAYRLNAGLKPLRLDDTLQAAAEREAKAMATADKPASADSVKRRLASGGLRQPEANLSAGYRSLAEAFSGWRDSAPHNKVMKAQNATRMGIATAYAPQSKYKVYWVLVVAE